MKAFVRAHRLWTPERGALSAEDGLARLSRFSRCCAAVLEEVRRPSAVSPLVVGTASGSSCSPEQVATELGERWQGAEVHLISSGPQTVPASLFEAIAMLERHGEVSWVVVELKAGVELVGAFTLANAPPGRRLALSRSTEAAPPPADHLNPCAAVSSLVVTTPRKSVSIKVGRWLMALESGD
ncbi:MAG: hypothetical protein ACE37F_00165 [Nannocystaceae bacterium]|nr:hypothetical protein [bacterium]